MKIAIYPKAESTILVSGTEGYVEYRIPGILPVKDSLLLACEGRSKYSDWGKVDILVYRLEAGRELQQVLKLSGTSSSDIPTTYNNPVLIPDGEKTHLIYHKNYDQVFIVTSEDGGKNWSNNREITNAYRKFPYEWNVSATGPGHGIQMKSGRLVVPIWLAKGKVLEDGTREHWPSVAGCAYSDDHGVTWNAGALADTIYDGNETTVAELEDGKLLFNFRHREDDKHRILGLSSDGGETFDNLWSAEDLQDPMCFGSMAAVKDGVLFVNCDSDRSRIDLTVKYSCDGGRSWEPVWKVDTEAGYSDIAVVDEIIYIFYEQIFQGRLKGLVLKQAKIVLDYEEKSHD